MKQLTSILAAAGFVMSMNLASGQLIHQVENVEQRRQREQSAQAFQEGDAVPELYPTESSDVGPQSVLKIKPRKSYVEAMADAQYFYTDNMFLSESNEQSTDVLVSTVQIALAPTAYEMGGGFFAPRIGYRHQWFNFGLLDSDETTVIEFGGPPTGSLVPLSEFDFNAQTLFTDVRWSRDNWIFDLGFDFTRLMTTDSYDQFYREFVPRWGVQRVFRLDERMAFAVGYAGNYRITDTRPLPLPAGASFDPDQDRTDHALTATYIQVICPHATLQPYYQFKYTHFMDFAPGAGSLEGRDDYLHSFGLAFHVSVCPGFEIRAFGDYNLRESSNESVAEYRQFDIGAGLNATIRF